MPFSLPNQSNLTASEIAAQEQQAYLNAQGPSVFFAHEIQALEQITQDARQIERCYREIEQRLSTFDAAIKALKPQKAEG